jgi:diadenosine tetraphosphate (Ap4A) HIT family hydrolase
MDCTFCQIIQGALESAVFWENNDFIATLDLFPNVYGQTLVISKQHYNSDLSDMSSEMYKQFFDAARSVSEILKRELPVYRVAMVLEGMGIDHAHIKLYPLHGLENTFHEMWAQERVFFEKYAGYITTQLGPKAHMHELKALSKKLSEIA